MKNISFFQVLKNNLECAFCKEKNCTVRFLPRKQKEFFHDGTRIILRCRKAPTAQERIDAIIKDYEKDERKHNKRK